MNAARSYAEFRAFLKQRGRTLKSLTVDDGVELAVAFYESVRFDDAAPDGDGIAYACSMISRPRGSRFALSMFRIFRSASDPTTFGRLRLAFCYGWYDVVKWLGRPDHGLAGHNAFAWSPSDVPKVLAVMKADPAYQVIRTRPPKSVELLYEPRFGVAG